MLVYEQAPVPPKYEWTLNDRLKALVEIDSFEFDEQLKDKVIFFLYIKTFQIFNMIFCNSKNLCKEKKSYFVFKIASQRNIPNAYDGKKQLISFLIIIPPMSGSKQITMYRKRKLLEARSWQLQHFSSCISYFPYHRPMINKNEIDY